MNFETEFPLGRKQPADWKHVDRYPYSAVQPLTAVSVERSLSLPAYRAIYDQGSEGACVGFGSSWAMSILNRKRYEPFWLWNEAKKIDEWNDTNPGDSNGTSVRAAMDVLRGQGHCRVYRGKTYDCDLMDGILENRWAQTVDEMRTSIANGIPVVIGVDWYRGFDKPIEKTVGKSKQYWLPKPEAFGRWRGGHCVCVYGASDRLEAFRMVNNWGVAYPLTLIPYETMQKLLDDYGEATLITDRVPVASA